MSYQYDVLRYMAKAKRMAILVKLLMNCKDSMLPIILH